MNHNELSSSDGELLVKAARKIVTEFLKNHNKIHLDGNFNSRFSFDAGVFVTLNNPQGLRGCIGFPLPSQKLSKGLFDASLAAALDDPRFQPVKFEELNEIIFEVTVLTTPEEIKVKTPEEYPFKINIGSDGLIVKHSFYSGLLLPQVPVEYNWNAKEFLEHTCEKAGLEKNSWLNPDITILKFEGIVFKEEEPNGKVIQVIL